MGLMANFSTLKALLSSFHLLFRLIIFQIPIAQHCLIKPPAEKVVYNKKLSYEVKSLQPIHTCKRHED